MIESRYDRQVRFPEFGESGQQQLESLTVFVVGVGALGSGIAEQLTRSGIGRLIILDKDIVSLSNLHRQSCYGEADVQEMLPKVFALGKHLKAINHEVDVLELNQEMTSKNIISLFDRYQPDIVVDGLDNYETRYLVNEATRQLNIPFIYSAVVGSKISGFPITGVGPCMVCMMPERPETMESCEINGVLPPAVHMASSLVVSEIFYYITHEDFSYTLTTMDINTFSMKNMNVLDLKESDCPVCAQKKYSRLNEENLNPVESLCGGVYQIRLSEDVFQDNLNPDIAIIKENGFIKRLQYQHYDITMFKDGRLLLYGAINRDEAEVCKQQIFI